MLDSPLGQHLGQSASREEIGQREQPLLPPTETGFRVVLDSCRIAVFSQDLNLRYTWFYNPQGELDGVNAIGKTDAEIFGEEQAREMIQTKLGVLNTGQGFQGEINNTYLGRSYWKNFVLQPLRDGSGQVVGLVGAASDISNQKRVQRDLSTSQERFRVALQGLKMVVFSQDNDLRYTWFYNAGGDVAACELVGKNDAEVMGKEESQILTALKQEVLDSGRPYRGELRLCFRKRWYRTLLILEPQYDDSGRTVGLTGAASDITELKDREEHLEKVIEFQNKVTAKLELEDLIGTIASCLRRLFHYDFASIVVCMPDLERPYLQAMESDIGDARTSWNLFPGSPEVRANSQARLYRAADLQAINSEYTRHLLSLGVAEIYSIPLANREGTCGRMEVGRKTEGGFGLTETRFLTEIASIVAVAVDNARAYREISRLRDKLNEEKAYLQGEIAAEWEGELIIGESPRLAECLSAVRLVAPSEATALLTGETGTGKELVARAIHAASPRSRHNFIKLNCAAIPAGLLESELFGHEKGAYTGAVGRKLGRIELADHGTLFLDEIGEMPLELQPKLLRVLQDQEFERLGGTKTVGVNVRIVAATNRDLAQCIEEGTFRRDLYYRLHVFPILVPTLRERQEDIPLLTAHFVNKFAARMKRPVPVIPLELVHALQDYNWPGNVRELENFVERCMIITQGRVLQAPINELRVTTQSQRGYLHTSEREHILQVLRDCGGVISGPNGAAARLGVKRTTLQSKLERMGITRQDFGIARAV